MIHLILIFSCVIAVYPILRVFSVSLRPGDRLLSTSLAIIPDDASFQAYVTVLTEKEFLVWVWNSAVITFSTAIVGVLLAATSAYAFSRWCFPGRVPGLIFLLSTQMIPAPMLMVPIFILASKLGLTQTYRGLVWVRTKFWGTLSQAAPFRQVRIVEGVKDFARLPAGGSAHETCAIALAYEPRSLR